MPTWGEILTQIQEAKERGIPNPYDRIRRYYLEQLHELTGNNIILYSTAWTYPTGGGPNLSINDRDVHAFMEVIHGLEEDGLDIILHSPGGSAESTEQIVSYIRDKFENVRIFVPQAAMSAATLLCCSADKLFMARHSAIGPIDPQFIVQSMFGLRKTASHAIIDELRMAQGAISTHNDLIPWLPLLRQYPPGLIAECFEANELSRDLAKDWSEKYMHSDKEDDMAALAAEEMSEYLSNREQFKSHSRRITMEQAEEHGFDVDPLESNQELQDAVLSVFHAAMHTHAGKPIMKIIENHNHRAVMTKSEGGASPGRIVAPTNGENGDDSESDDEEESNGSLETEDED